VHNPAEIQGLDSSLSYTRQFLNYSIGLIFMKGNLDTDFPCRKSHEIKKILQNVSATELKLV